MKNAYLCMQKTEDMTNKVLYLIPLMMLGACGKIVKGGEEVRPVNVVEVKAANGGETVSFPGQTRSEEEVNVSFRIRSRQTSRIRYLFT